MNEIQYLLGVAGEECCEIAQRASKCVRFGVNEKQPGQLLGLDNAERLVQEYADLQAVMEMLEEHGAIKIPDLTKMKAAKKEKVLKFMEYSRECGTLK